MRVATLFSLAAATALVGAAPTSTGSSESVANMKDKIKNFVVLVMENRSFDNLLGGQTLAGLDNPKQSGPFCNPMNLTDASAGKACAAPNDLNSVIDDPDHNVYGNNNEFYGTFTPDNKMIKSGKLKPTMQGFVDEQIRIYGDDAQPKELAKMVMNYYTEKQVSVLTALTQNFVTFNNWHSAIPGPTNPNRVALHSGTSSGAGANTFSWGSMHQMSIFQKVTELGLTWKNYYDNSTSGAEEDAMWFNWTSTSGNTHLVQTLSNFYHDAKAGTLPDYTVIGPTCCGVGTTSMHPQGLISDGENFIKEVYEALRASPQWNQSALLITFDETGGFHDHVAPPMAPRPDSLTYTALTPSGENYTFPFDRLGGRIPTWLISPWVAQGYVENQGTNSKGKTVTYSAGSMLRTLGYLWDFAPFTPRVASAPAFDGLFQTIMRTDTPKKLPAVHKW